MQRRMLIYWAKGHPEIGVEVLRLDERFAMYYA